MYKEINDIAVFAQSGSKTPIPVPEGNIPIDPVEFLIPILNCYKDIEVTRETEQTKRVEARERARVAIAAFEAHTQEYTESLHSHHEQQMKLIEIVSFLVSRTDLDENTVKLCEMLLNTLQHNQEVQVSRIGSFTFSR